MPRPPKLTATATGPSPQASMAKPPEGPRPTGSAWPAALVTTYGPERGRRFDLELGRTLLGHAPDADIRLSTDGAASRHASLTNDGERVVLASLTTESPTLVNGQSVTRRELEHGDELGIGRTRFRFLQHENLEARHHEEIYRLATLDPLTQVYGKRFFHETLHRALRGADGRGLIALARIDLDHFERINAAFGHGVGDDVLRAVALVLQEHAPEGSALGRYGGNQFCLLLRGTGVDEAERVCERMRESLARAQLCFEGRQVHVTASIGLTSGATGATTSEALLDDADAALREAKRTGRNRVVSNE